MLRKIEEKLRMNRKFRIVSHTELRERSRDNATTGLLLVMAFVGWCILIINLEDFFWNLAQPKYETYIQDLLLNGTMSLLGIWFVGFGVVSLALSPHPTHYYERYLKRGLDTPIVIRPGIFYWTLVLFVWVFMVMGGGWLLLEVRANPNDPENAELIFAGLLAIGFFGPLCIYASLRGLVALRSGFIRIEANGIYMHAVGSLMPWEDLGPAFVSEQIHPRGKKYRQDGGDLHLRVRNLPRYATQRWPFNRWANPDPPDAAGLYEVRVEPVFRHVLSNRQMVEIINNHAKIGQRKT